MKRFFYNRWTLKKEIEEISSDLSAFPDVSDKMKNYKEKRLEQKKDDQLPAIELKNLIIDFGETLAVDDVSFKIEKGSLVTLLGPSGSGKTTALNAIAGLLTPTSGKILFQGNDVTKYSPQKRKLGFVFQNYALYPHLSVYANIAFPLKNDGHWKNTIYIKRELAKLKVAGIFLKRLGASQDEIDSLYETLSDYFYLKEDVFYNYERLIISSLEKIEAAKSHFTLVKVHKDAQLVALSKSTLKKIRLAKEEYLNLNGKALLKHHEYTAFYPGFAYEKNSLKIRNPLFKISGSLDSVKANMQVVVETIQKIEDELTKKLKYQDIKKLLKNLQKQKIALYKYNHYITTTNAINKFNAEFKEAKKNYLETKTTYKSAKTDDTLLSEAKKEKALLPLVLLKIHKNIKKELNLKYKFEEIIKKNRKKRVIEFNDQEKEEMAECAKDIISMKDAIHRDVMEVSNRVEIVQNLQKKPTRLSGGQQQRVSIARAIVKKPKILLMDEPLSNLDAKLRVSTRQWIRNIQQTLGITTVFVTHDQEEAMSISDVVICMSTAKVQQSGTPLELYNHPENEFVATFLGVPEMSLISAQVTDGNVYIQGKLLKDVLIPEKDFGNIKIGVRGEDFKVKESPTEKSLTADVVAVENFGKDSKVVVHVQNIGQINMLLSNEFNYVIGDKIHFELPIKRLHVFDETTKMRIGYKYI